MIKVTVGEQKTQSEKPFPKLMIGMNRPVIVLMLEPKIGIVIKPNGYYDIGYKSASFAIESFTDYLEHGYYSDEWNMPYFIDYNEPITLQNA